MKRDPEFFSSGEVTIEATIENCRLSWPVSGDDLESECSNELTLDNLSDELLECLDTSDLSWDRCDITAVPSWEGITFSASASIDIALATGIRKVKAKGEDEDEADIDIDMLPDSIASALEGDGYSVGFNHPDVEDVDPTVSAEWKGRKIRVTVEVPTTLRAWTEPLPSLEQFISSACDLSSVPADVRKLLDVSGDHTPWDSVDITDESDESGIGYSATATVSVTLNGMLDDDDEDTLRDALQDNYLGLLADSYSTEYECDDGGSVTVHVEQEFDEPESPEDGDDEDSNDDEDSDEDSEVDDSDDAKD